MMRKDSLRRLYIDELKDLYSAETQLVKALPKMAKASSSAELRQAFEEHLRQTSEQVSRLEQIFETLEEKPTGKKCMGMEGLVKEGADVSIITYGAVVHRAEVAAAALQRDGISAEIIDLRSLVPYDWEAIAATVRKTHRVIVAYEDMMSFGYGAEISSRIAEELFDELDAPIKRVAATDTFCGYQPKLEDATLPQTGDIANAVKRILEY